MWETSIPKVNVVIVLNELIDNHNLMKNLENLNATEDKIFLNKEIHPKEITPKKLEEFSKKNQTN